jgi:hypothetical protein
MNLSFEFYHHPQEVEKIPADAGIRAGFLGVRQQLGTFYIAFDPLLSNLGTTAIAGTEISRVTGKYFMVPTAAGFTEPLNASLSAGGYEFPIYNCGNANSTTFVLEMRPGSTNRIAYGNNCAVIYARSPNETILMADLFVYKLTGVIPDNQYDR